MMAKESKLLQCAIRPDIMENSSAKENYYIVEASISRGKEQLASERREQMGLVLPSGRPRHQYITENHLLLMFNSPTTMYSFKQQVHQILNHIQNSPHLIMLFATVRHSCKEKSRSISLPLPSLFGLKKAL